MSWRRSRPSRSRGSRPSILGVASAWTPSRRTPMSLTRRPYRGVSPSTRTTSTTPSTEYDDELAEAHRSLVFDRAWHVRHLVDHAADLAYTIVDCAHTGDEESAIEYLGQRDELADKLDKAFKLWEYALAGQMSGPDGPSEQVAAFTRWLDDATRAQ